MTERTITEGAMEHIMLCKPGAKIENRETGEFLVWPEYDFDNDKDIWAERRIIRSGKPQPGETRTTEAGNKVSIVDPLARLLGFGQVKDRNKDKPDE